jgi:hypothetical protein
MTPQNVKEFSKIALKISVLYNIIGDFVTQMTYMQLNFSIDRNCKICKNKNKHDSCISVGHSRYLWSLRNKPPGTRLWPSVLCPEFLIYWYPLRWRVGSSRSGQIQMITKYSWISIVFLRMRSGTYWWRHGSRSPPCRGDDKSLSITCDMFCGFSRELVIYMSFLWLSLTYQSHYQLCLFYCVIFTQTKSYELV